MRPLTNQRKDVSDTRGLWNTGQDATRKEWADPVRSRFDEHHARRLSSQLAALAADLERADLSFESILARLYERTY